MAVGAPVAAPVATSWQPDTYGIVPRSDMQRERAAIVLAEGYQEVRRMTAGATHRTQINAAHETYVGGAVWRGTATRHSDIFIQLFCDDPKSAEIGLIDMGVRFDVSTVTGFQGEKVDALSVHALCPALGEYVGVHLLVYDFDDLRGALKADARGRRPRGDMAALRNLLHDAPHA